jgi:hypothetical protein
VVELILEVGGRSNPFVRTTNPVPPSPIAAGNASLPVEVDYGIYEGIYVLEMEGQPVELQIFIEEDRLMADLGGLRQSPLLHRSDHAFTVAVRPGDSIVFDVENGLAVSLIFTMSGQMITGARRP